MTESLSLERMAEDNPLRVCYFGTYRAAYTRNRILISGLRARGVVVYECHAPLWTGIEDRVQTASGGWASCAFLGRLWRAYRSLLLQHARVPEYDVMLIGYPGQLDAYLGRILSWWRRVPMVLDVLMSLHLVAKERGLTQSHPATGKLIFYLEKLGLRLPNRLLVENDQYGSYLEQAYKLSRERIRYLPHGADDQVYRPRHAVTSDQLFRVVYHGSFVPSHGLDTVVKAARLLACHPEIQFDLYGTGPESAAIELEASIPSHRNMHFHGYVDTEQLLDGISRAGVCLGVFGDTKQSLCTVQNKIWEGMAMAVAVISGRPGIVESVLQHREHIYLVERCDPEALASGILELKNNPELRRSIASKGYQFFMQGHSTLALGAKAEELLLDVLSSNRQNPKTVESS